MRDGGGGVTGEIGFGWAQLTSIDESLDPIEGFLLNADLIWRPTPMTMVEFLARTEVDTTTFVDALGAVDRGTTVLLNEKAH